MSLKIFYFFVPLLLTPSSKANDHLTGHLKPLGSQVPPVGDVLTISEVPSPQEFFDEYVKPGKPVLFKGAATTTPAFKLWTDDYLRY
jgi:lysine-specific demethylase 8